MDLSSRFPTLENLYYLSSNIKIFHINSNFESFSNRKRILNPVVLFKPEISYLCLVFLRCINDQIIILNTYRFEMGKYSTPK